MHYLRGGVGPGVVLPHGWPQTNHGWRKVLPALATEYTVLAPDLRGYGRTDKPRDGYDKRMMAPVWPRWSSRWASTRWRWSGTTGAAGWRTVGPGPPGPGEPAGRAGHPAHSGGVAAVEPRDGQAVLALDLPLAAGPARTAGGRGRGRLPRPLLRALDLQPVGIGQRGCGRVRPSVLRAGFDDYRASFPDDAEDDDADYAAGKRLSMPVLALWGQAALFGDASVLDVWRDYADDVTGQPIAECGHFLAEERPDALVALLRPFLAGGKTTGVHERTQNGPRTDPGGRRAENIGSPKAANPDAVTRGP